MPLVRIDIDASISPETRNIICDAVYDAMTSTANVPAHDKFMVVSRHEAGDIVFPGEGYLGIRYTPGIVIIQITWNAGRTTDVKKAFYGKVADDIHAARKTCGSTSSRSRRKTGPSVTAKCSTRRSSQFKLAFAAPRP